MLARFQPIFGFELNEKSHKPSRAKNPSARLGLITNKYIDFCVKLLQAEKAGTVFMEK